MGLKWRLRRSCIKKRRHRSQDPTFQNLTALHDKVSLKSSIHAEGEAAAVKEAEERSFRTSWSMPTSAWCV